MKRIFLLLAAGSVAFLANCCSNCGSSVEPINTGAPSVYAPLK